MATKEAFNGYPISGWYRVARLLIRERRWDIGISAWQLSRMVGVSESTINILENNLLDPRLSQLEKIAKALNCRLSDLFDEEN